MKAYRVEINKYGDIRWYKPDTYLLHREDGPAVEFSNGTKCWYKNGLRHREDSPAVEFSNGDKHWYKNNILHREDGPAIEFSNGNKHWYQNGKHHREDGPAVEYSDGYTSYYLNGIHFSSKELYEKELAKRKNSCANKVVEIDGKKYKLVEV